MKYFATHLPKSDCAIREKQGRSNACMTVRYHSCVKSRTITRWIETPAQVTAGRSDRKHRPKHPKGLIAVNPMVLQMHPLESR